MSEQGERPEEACALKAAEAELVRSSSGDANASYGKQSKEITFAHPGDDFSQSKLQLREDTNEQVEGWTSSRP